MNRIEIKGIIPPIITPMHADESINTAELRRQVDRQIENGVHALFCFGTNGEGYILDGREKQLVLETVIEQANGRVPVYAGTGCVSTRETIAQSRMARDAGADVLSIITPSFAAASQQELYDHYRAVAEAVDIPIVLYNIPARTGNALAPETVASLSRIENIVGAKDSSGNWDNMKAYLDGTRGRLSRRIREPWQPGADAFHVFQSAVCGDACAVDSGYYKNQQSEIQDHRSGVVCDFLKTGLLHLESTCA